jgi:hypothetical protein
MTASDLARLPPLYLIHGEDDTTVPYLSTAHFAHVLSSKHGIRDDTIHLRILKEGCGGGHSQVVTDVMGITVADTYIPAVMDIFRDLTSG